MLTKISGVPFDEALKGSGTFDLEGHLGPGPARAGLQREGETKRVAATSTIMARSLAGVQYGFSPPPSFA